ncbi:MAG: hypothetical protein LBQ34_07100 [Alphaproteobacteria bacterium]|nr:hypothetical protein [Alphaproteobacteria bacterium]
MLYLDYPSKVLCVLTGNGTLALGYLSSSGCAWTSHNLGDGVKISSMSATYDEGNQYLYLATTRKILGRDKQFIELITFDALRGLYMENVAAPIYLDLYSHKAMVDNVIGDLDLFNGESMSVLSYDGTYLGDFKVVNGSITVEGNAYANGEVRVGYCFASAYQTPNLEKSDTTAGEVKIDKVELSFYRTSHVDVLGSANTIQRNILAKEVSGYQNISLNINGNWEANSSLMLQQSLPFAMNIVAINLSILSK